MFVRSLPVRFEHACQASADRHLVSQHHRRLVANRYWDCCTSPSRALTALGVLKRSGTIVDKLDTAASGALSAMAPSMTRNELLLLGRLSSFLRLKCGVDIKSSLVSAAAAEKSSPDADANAGVLTLYSQFIGHRLEAVAVEVIFVEISSDAVLRLGAITSLMLVEMVLTTSFQAGASWRDETILYALTTRLRHHVVNSDVIDFRALWWLLDILSGKQSLLLGRPSDCARLFRACIRRIHELLPNLSIGECLLVFPLLDASPYDRPFIICADVARRLAACEMEELIQVPTPVVLQALACEGLNPHVTRKLCMMLQKDLRIGDLGKNECLMLLSTLETRTPAGGMDDANEDEDRFRESLLAQIYFNAKNMTAVECVKVLESLELMSLSHPSVLLPYSLLERLKRRAFRDVRQALKQPSAKMEDFELSLESLHRLERLLRRCALLPFLRGDAEEVSELSGKLMHQLKLIDVGAL